MIIHQTQRFAQVGLKDYDKLVDDAASETTDLNKRYEKYAAAKLG